MVLSLWGLIEAAVLCLNAVCILHEERFLAKIGWGTRRNNTQYQGFNEEPTIKSNIIELIKAIRTVMRVPLIPLNIIIIVKKLLFG